MKSLPYLHDRVGRLVLLALASTFVVLLAQTAVKTARRMPLALPKMAARKDSKAPPAQATTSLFRSLQSLGVRAIGHAEGTLTLQGKPTASYYGHRDPGNGKHNQGWCSDQGRGGGNVNRANEKCLVRMRDRLTLLNQDLKATGIDPDKETEIFLNAADLYNQASPWVSRQFPGKYVAARKQGKQGESALVWARVEAFRRNGRIDASGLLGICRREQRKMSPWDCVAGDQRRRVRAIARVVEQNSPLPPRFVWPAQGTVSQKFSASGHPGLDIANRAGTSIVAPQAGKVVYAGWNEFGYGNYLKIQHGDGTITAYGHNQRLLVKAGQQVAVGEPIALMGSTGNSTGSHLHFEVRRGGEFVDPYPLLGAVARCGSGKKSQRLATLTFVNGTGQKVSVHSVNRNCQEVRSKILLPGQTFRQRSYLGYVWRVRDREGKLLKAFSPSTPAPFSLVVSLDLD